LWIGQSISNAGSQITAVAVSIQIYDLTRSSLAVGLLGLAAFIPLLFFGLWGGVLADAMDRRVLLLVGSFTIWGSTLGLIIQAFINFGNIVLIMLLIAVQSAGFAVIGPTQRAIIPRLLPVELVPAGNTLCFMAPQLSFLVGPALGGALVAYANYTVAYAIDALLFTFLLYAAFKMPAIPPLGDRAQRPGFQMAIDGLRFLVTQPVVSMSFVVDIIAMVVAMPRALFPEVAELHFGSKEAAGWLVSAIALGAVGGALVSGWMARVRRQGIALIVLISIWGGTVALSGLAGELWLVILLLAIGGAADLASGVFRQTILQVHVPDHMRGRLQGIFTVVVAGGPRLGDLRAGATAAVVGSTVSWVGGGVACVILVIIVGMMVPLFRRFDTRTANGDAPKAG
jgi:MFS family permease